VAFGGFYGQNCTGDSSRTMAERTNLSSHHDSRLHALAGGGGSVRISMFTIRRPSFFLLVRVLLDMGNALSVVVPPRTEDPDGFPMRFNEAGGSLEEGTMDV